MSIPKVLVLPFPAQGHVNPMMILSRKLVENGIKVIFVNTEINHKKVISSMGEQQQDHSFDGALKLVSVPDGLGPAEDRTDFGKSCVAMLSTMPSMLEKIIKDNEVSFMVVDASVGWSLEVGRKMGIDGALFWPASTAMFAFAFNIPKLIQDGIIDSNGLSSTRKTFRLSPSMSMMNTEALLWTNVVDSTNTEKFVNYILQCFKHINFTEWWLCNTTFELEPGPLSFLPKLLPIGPLLNDSENQIAKSMGQFWEEDSSCISWLDQQENHSVVYVAFGSIALFDQNQFKEIALGLDLTNRPFLWVVRQDSNSTNQIEFKGSKGKIVKWTPQQRVISHPSIACFVSHCGWNSCLEGLSNGVPFLCWPHFSDQFYNKSYICDELKVGLGFEKDENGLVPHGEIKMKVDQLLSDQNIRAKSMELKEKVMRNIAHGGRSSENFNKFVKWLKE